MNRLRTGLSVLMGLVLLLQGLAVSAAPHARRAEVTAALAAAADPPCHRQKAPAKAEPPASCCDEDCPHMARCLLGQLAPAVTLCMSVPPPARTEPGAASLFSTSPLPRALLRPPIPLHG
ncbi:hypothetical protein SAMN04488120_12112 [Fontimonas thermophila]|uniref:Uncharacterized protein n=1 Tax=Fontimonas thermophila TaxID=1076937 RepID=A0A1I2KIL0_9GAMM|nr:hypothetical protein [Fontimonas thermophila]SFF66835.1 hypothetical protein SAMN04488120_12112 [Fontimonas thermophila]